MRISDLLQLSSRKLVCIQVLMSVRQAVSVESLGDGSDGFGGEIELCVIGIAMKVEAVAAEYVTKGEHVENE